MKNSWYLDRRTLLKGVGATLALPFLEAMIPAAGAAAAAGAKKPPIRFGIWYYQHGSLAEYWMPPETGPIKKVPSLLRPLEFARDKMTILSNLTNSGFHEGRWARGGHQQECHLFTCTKNLTSKTASVSIDQYIAQKIGHHTPLESLGLMECGYSKTFSRDAATVVTGENSPRLVFDRLFRRGKAQAELSDHSILDAVLEQIATLKNRVGRQDQRQLDQYMESVRSTERRLMRVDQRQQELEADRSSKSASLKVEGLPKAARYEMDNSDREQVERYLRLMADLLVLAFQTDMTRVATYHMGNFGSFPDVVTVGTEFDYHSLAHSGATYSPDRADPIHREAFREVQHWFSKNCAYLIQRLDAIKEPNGTLLDNSLILYASDLAAGDHTVENIPMVLLGSGGGILKTGRHVRCEKYTPSPTCTSSCSTAWGFPPRSSATAKPTPRRRTTAVSRCSV